MKLDSKPRSTDSIGVTLGLSKGLCRAAETTRFLDKLGITVGGKRCVARPANGTRGFTFAELLVLVAIGAVLAGLVLPNLSQTRSKLLQAACAANLKQWGIGLTMYLSDYNDYFYPCTNPWSNNSNPYVNYLVATDSGSVAQGTGAGVRYRRMRNCPAYTATVPETYITQVGPVTYAFVRPFVNLRDANGAVTGWGPVTVGGGGRITSPYTLRLVPKPSKFLLIIDAPSQSPYGSVIYLVTATGASCLGGSCNDFYQMITSTSADQGQSALSRHGGGVNVLFGDSHVEFVTQAECQRQSNFGTLSIWFAAETPTNTLGLVLQE